MTDSKHTPTPDFGEMPLRVNHYPSIEDEEVVQVADATGIRLIANVYPANARERAAHIVRCVNAHDGLVEALRFYAGGGGVADPADVARGDIDLARASEALTEDCGDVARSALAKLEER